MTELEDRLRADLRDLADALSGARIEEATAEATPDGPQPSARRVSVGGLVAAGVAVCAAVLVVAGGVVFSDDSSERTAVGTVGEFTSTTEIIAKPSLTSSWSGPGFSELPASGIAVAADGALVLYDYAGAELARATTPAAAQLQSSNGRRLAAIRPGPSVEAVPADRAEPPPGCGAAASGGGVRVALCGGSERQPQRVESVAPTGERRVIAGPPEGSNGLGHWETAIPSPDGRWVLATWSGECESPTAFLVPSNGHGPATTIDGRLGLPDAVGSSGIDWAPDGRAIVEVASSVCGAAAAEPGIHLLEPAHLETELVIALGDREQTVHLWRIRADGNDAEWIFADVLERLGVEGCCGEPSHGGLALTAGVRWHGYDIPVGATPPGSTDALPFNDLVLSAKPVDLDGTPVTAGDGPLGPFVAFSCGDRIWTFGGAGAGDRASPEAVRGLAAAVLPLLGCTVADRPLAGR